MENEHEEKSLIKDLIDLGVEILAQLKIRRAEGYISKIEIGFQSKENIFIINNTIKGKIIMLSLKDTEKAIGTLAFTDAKGSSVPVANETITATIADPTVATVTVDAVAGTVTVTAVKGGATTLTIDGKATDGTDAPFADTAIQVTAGDATGGTVTFAAPIAQ